MPLPPTELRLGAPLEAQEASYLAASARMASLDCVFTVQIYSYRTCRRVAAYAAGLLRPIRLLKRLRGSTTRQHLVQRFFFNSYLPNSHLR